MPAVEEVEVLPGEVVIEQRNIVGEDNATQSAGALHEPTRPQRVVGVDRLGDRQAGELERVLDQLGDAPPRVVHRHRGCVGDGGVAGDGDPVLAQLRFLAGEGIDAPGDRG